MTFVLKSGRILPNARAISTLIHGQPQEDVEDSENRYLRFLLFLKLRK